MIRGARPVVVIFGLLTLILLLPPLLGAGVEVLQTEDSASPAEMGFRGPQVATRTILWSVSTALLATLLGWWPGRRLASNPTGWMTWAGADTHGIASGVALRRLVAPGRPTIVDWRHGSERGPGPVVARCCACDHACLLGMAHHLVTPHGQEGTGKRTVACQPGWGWIAQAFRSCVAK